MKIKVVGFVHLPKYWKSISKMKARRQVYINLQNQTQISIVLPKFEKHLFHQQNVSAWNRAVVKPFKIDTKNECWETSLYDSSKSISNLNGFTNVLKIIDFINKMRVREIARSSSPSKSNAKMNSSTNVLDFPRVYYFTEFWRIFDLWHEK